jgi:DNA-binding beta-propeller fold protein YncE
MNLSDQLHELADRVDTRPFTPAEDIRRVGDRFRRQQRARLSVGAASLTVLAVVVALTWVLRPHGETTPSPVGPIDGWRLEHTWTVPGSGVVLQAADSLWAVDTADGELTSDGTSPAGATYQIDPQTGQVLDVLQGAVGGWPSVGAGALWLSTAAGGLDVLTKVDLVSHELTRVRTSRPRQLPHGAVVAGGHLWVANYGSGDLLQMDPTTLRTRHTIHFGDLADGGLPQSIVSDGKSLWVSFDNGLVRRLDARTGAQTSQLQLPVHEARLSEVDPQRHVLYASGVRGDSLFQIHISDRGPDRLGNELALSRVADSILNAVAVSPDSIWVAITNPDELLRIDPETFTIVARVPISGIDHTSNVGVALAAAPGTVWVRVEDRLVTLTGD